MAQQTKISLLPLSRIRTIMKSAPDVGNISPDAVFLTAKAAEGFVAFLARQALKASDDKALVDYKDLAKVVSNIENLDFLKDIVPPKITGSQYLEIMQRVEMEERQIAEEDKLL